MRERSEVDGLCVIENALPLRVFLHLRGKGVYAGRDGSEGNFIRLAELC